MKTILTLTSLLTLSFCQSSENKFIQACEDEMRSRLKSPSSYVQTSKGKVIFSPYTVAWDRKWANSSDETKDRNARGKNGDLQREMISVAEATESQGDTFIATSIISYEASNSYGVMLSNKFICEVTAKAKVLPKEYTALTELRVNGHTSFDYDIHQLKKLKGLN